MSLADFKSACLPPSLEMGDSCDSCGLPAGPEFKEGSLKWQKHANDLGIKGGWGEGPQNNETSRRSTN